MKKLTNNANQHKIGHKAMVWPPIAKVIGLQALVESEARFRSIVLWSLDAIIVTDAKGKIEYMNPAAEGVFNRKLGSFIGKDFGLPLVDGESTEIDIFRPGKDPGVGDMYVVESEWLNKKAHLITIRDITERKKVEEELEKSKIRLDVATEASQIGVWELDLINDTSIRNLMHDQIFGYEKKISEWGEKIFFEHIIPEDRPSVHEAFDRVMKTDTLYFECRIIWPNKIIHWISVRGKVIPDSTGEPQKMFGTVMDISERKKAEEETGKHLQELEVFYKASIGREERIIELKKEIEQLKKELGK